AQLAVAVALNTPRDRAVVDECGPLAPSALHMAVERIVAGIDHPTAEPAVERGIGVIEHPLPALEPMDLGRGLPPEPLRIAERALVDRIVAIGHGGVPRAGAALSRGIASRPCSFEQYPQSGSLAKAVCGRLIARIRA